MKTRFCPSPTGQLHLGNLRTAVFCYLAAQHSGGNFLLRIEDTDLERSKAAHIEEIVQDLHWLGIDWSLGYPDLGNFGPYLQSERSDIYRQYLEKLEKAGLVYRCYCTPERLDALRKSQAAQHLPPRYDNRCRHLPPETRQTYEDEACPYVLRFAIPSGKVIEWEDLIKGSLSIAGSDLGDFVLCRSDGAPGFLFTNAIDDALMQINTVIRGEDHLSNTANQILLLQALDFPQPVYAHLGLLMDHDGSPLSKRKGSIGLAALRKRGILPEAILNYLARTGNAVPQDAPLMQRAALSSAFDLRQLASGPVAYDEAGLIYWQRMCLQAMSPSEVEAWAQPVIAAYPDCKVDHFILDVLAHNCHDWQDAHQWLKALSGPVQPFSPDALAQIACSVSDLAQLYAAVERHDQVDWAQVLPQVAKDFGLHKGKLMRSLRFIATRHMGGPSLWEVLDYLGTDRIKASIQLALNAMQHGGD